MYRNNVQGDVTHIYTTDGKQVGHYVYDAWGNMQILQDRDGVATLNPFRYRSYYFDEETGLYYLQTRYYDPEVGRFVNADGIEYLDPETLGGLNLYAYCGNNPIMGIDPEGTEVTFLTVLERIFTSFADFYIYVGRILTKPKSHVTKHGSVSYRSKLRNYDTARTESIKLGKTLGKIATALSFITLGVDIGVSVFNNVKNEQSVGKILEDVVDIVARFSIGWGITALFSSLIPIPFVGSLIGGIVAVVVDNIIVKCGGVVQIVRDTVEFFKDVGQGLKTIGSSIVNAWNRFWGLA